MSFSFMTNVEFSVLMAASKFSAICIDLFDCETYLFSGSQLKKSLAGYYSILINLITLKTRKVIIEHKYEDKFKSSILYVSTFPISYQFLMGIIHIKNQSIIQRDKIITQENFAVHLSIFYAIQIFIFLINRIAIDAISNPLQLADIG